MKFLLTVGASASLIIVSLLFASHSLGQTQEVQTSDFTTAVQAGLQSLAINPGAQSQQQEIQNQDYKSTWDEFGVNALIDGATQPAEVDKKINQDVTQAVQIEANYDQQEAKYIENSSVTPEEIQAMEESGGSDIPPGEPIVPNPSLEANPDVDVSSVEDAVQKNNIEANSPSPGTGENTTETVVPAPETSVSANENSIFEAILQGEQAADQTPPPESPPPPAETPPTE